MDSNPEEHTEEIDRISELPDAILEQILYLLPTKIAVATSILSKKWKNLSPFCVQPIRLNLDDTLFLHPIDEDTFMYHLPNISFKEFVDKLLNQTLSDVPCVESMVLKCDHRYRYSDDSIASWVCAASRLNVRHLYLKMHPDGSPKFFNSLNACKGLVKLQLRLPYQFLEQQLCAPDNFELPNLKRLDLYELFFDDMYPVNDFIQGCPALEDLYLWGCWFLCGYVSIQTLLLKNLIVEDCSGGDYHTPDLALDAPNLQLLIYGSFVASCFTMCEYKSVHTAHFNTGSINGNSLNFRELSSRASRIDGTAICLSERTVDALRHSPVQLPVFQYWSRKIMARNPRIVPAAYEPLTIEEEGFQKNERESANFERLVPLPHQCFGLKPPVELIYLSTFEGESWRGTKFADFFPHFHDQIPLEIALHCNAPVCEDCFQLLCSRIRM